MKIYRVTATILDSTMLWKPKGIILIHANNEVDAMTKFDRHLITTSTRPCKARNVKVEKMDLVNGIIHEEYMPNYDNK